MLVLVCVCVCLLSAATDSTFINTRVSFLRPGQPRLQVLHTRGVSVCVNEERFRFERGTTGYSLSLSVSLSLFHSDACSLFSRSPEDVG